MYASSKGAQKVKDSRYLVFNETPSRDVSPTEAGVTSALAVNKLSMAERGDKIATY
jgi:hypothetical protein